MRVEEIVELLKQVKNPFTEMSIVEEGLVTKVEVDEDEGKTIIYVAFARFTPLHPFAMAVNWPIQRRIVEDMVNVLEDRLGYFEIVDDTTLQRYYPLDKTEV